MCSNVIWLVHDARIVKRSRRYLNQIGVFGFRPDALSFRSHAEPRAPNEADVILVDSELVLQPSLQQIRADETKNAVRDCFEQRCIGRRTPRFSGPASAGYGVW